MSVSLGTSTSNLATAQSIQRKIVKTDAGKLVMFAYIGSGSGNRIRYKTSSDNGETWDGSWTEAFNDNDILNFDIHIDTNNDILIVVKTTGNEFKFKKLTYSAGSWSNGSAVTVHGSTTFYNPVITRRSNGNIWVTASFDSGNNLWYWISTNEGANWSATFTTIDIIGYSVGIIPNGSDIWVIVDGDGKLENRVYNGSSWSLQATITASGMTSSNSNLLGIGKSSDSEIWIVGRTASGLKVFYWNGLSWDSGTLISDQANDQSPTISISNNYPVILWRDYNGATYDIVYRNWTGSIWASQIGLTTGVTVDYPTTNILDTTWLYTGWTQGSGSPYDIYFDKVNLNPTKQETILSDAKIRVLNNQQTILSDANITSITNKTILSDAKIKVIGIQETILSDAKIIDIYQKTILSDAKIKVIGIQETILSDAKISIPVTYDINNKSNIVIRVLSDINNKINTVKRVLSDINNKINTVKRVLSDINNDFRDKLLVKNNITNDVRFLASWQVPGDAGFQSLGKSYIRVYIGGVEQTDVDINSINISKELNISHTATFILGRAYDSTKPSIESTVQIKYNNFILYSGYITQITPSDSPESMRIQCQDKYWQQNKTNKYYQVGHKPQDDKELYYETIKLALSTEHSWTLDIGDFVPQIINNFAVGQSDAITNLILDCGNFGWYYDVNGNKRLWRAGEGNIIEIQKQAIGENLGLYDLLNHSFSDNIENLVNKYRVQMGEKVIRKFNSTGGNRIYTGYNYSSYRAFVNPAWDRSYEVLAKDSGIGEGWDWHKPENADLYRDIFKKYNMPYLDSELSSWSDRYPPYVEIYGESMFGAPVGRLYEGFTIDYENKTITFNDPIYSYETDSNGEVTSIRAPIVRVFLWKKNYYTYTEDPTDDPETDISNPLMFFTSKMGSYPDTIIKDLNLSNLSIQEGGIRILEDGTQEVIPSWDDTDFAEDYANWQLSQQCDKKIRGTIEITLDTLCFYNIDLENRIFIDNITESAMNILSMDYDISNFTVTLTLENSRTYKRTISLQSRGE